MIQDERIGAGAADRPRGFLPQDLLSRAAYPHVVTALLLRETHLSWVILTAPFDCLEFDPKLRMIDVLNDVAFLLMDLVAHGRDDLAAAFLNRYLERTGDYSGVPLLPLYAVHRAVIRAMVDALAIENTPLRQNRIRERLQARRRTA